MTDLVILVGGRGKRLGKLTEKIPKPLVQIGNIKFLDILISKIIRFNFENIYLMCSYQKKKFFKLYHNKKIHNSKVVCIDEGYQKDTAGGLIRLKKKIKKNFFLINGDSLFDIDLKKLIKFKNSKTIGNIAITKNINYIKNDKLNNIKINNSNIISYSKLKTNLMNGGIYFFKKKIFKYLSNTKISLENDVLKKLIYNDKIEGLFFNKKFIDIGTPKNLFFLKKNPNFLKQKAAFLDRDGVINILKKRGYIENIEEFNFLPGVYKAIKYLNKLGYLVIIVTNQACVGKSIITENKLNEIHKYMKDHLMKKNKAYIDDIFYSPYYKFSKKKKFRLYSKDRKPNTGMFLKAIKKWNIDLDKSFFIGDSSTDEISSKKLNLKFYYKQKGSLYNQIVKNEKHY